MGKEGGKGRGGSDGFKQGREEESALPQLWPSGGSWPGPMAPTGVW